MYDSCPVCGLRFLREAGYFLGAMYISYTLGVATVLPVSIVLAIVLEWPLWARANRDARPDAGKRAAVSKVLASDLGACGPVHRPALVDGEVTVPYAQRLGGRM
jgi:hypothetical protein